MAIILSIKSTRIKAFASISTLFGRFDQGLLSDCIKPKLFICSENDFAASIEEVKQRMPDISDPRILEIITNCDHFYINKGHGVASKVYEFFTSYSHT